MKILAIDTSSKNAAVAILENQNTIIELNNDDEKTHSQKLMPMIDEAFKKSNLSLDDMEKRREFSIKAEKEITELYDKLSIFNEELYGVVEQMIDIKTRQ